MYKIGIDLGGTKIEGVLVDESFQTIEKERIATVQEDGYQSILEKITNMINRLNEKSDQSTTIGICTPGAISKETGLIKNSNTQCIIGRDLQKDLENMLRHKISLENDANCFALAEARLGAGKNSNIVFGVIIGTGVGGGIIIDGKIHSGRTNIAGEWGHHCLHVNGNRCYCGKLGCVETYISGPALERHWSDLTNEELSLPDIIKNYDQENFQKWRQTVLDNFGLALANVIDILDPDIIVLGGGVSNIDFLYNEGKNAVYDRVFSDTVDTPIVKNELGDSAGVFGACML